MYNISGEVVKFIENNMQNWRVKRKSCSENPVRDLPGNCTVTINIHNCDGATK